MDRHSSLIELIDYFAQEALREAEKGNAFCDPTELAFLKTETKSDDELFRILRGLLNQRPPLQADESIRTLEEIFFKEEAERKGITDSALIFSGKKNEKNRCISNQLNKTALWKGDFTALRISAVVNYASPDLSGCWIPGHNCIDNRIHTFAGTKLRYACSKIILAQGFEENPGNARLTKAYSLPSEYIIHTVLPEVHFEITEQHRETLDRCIESCLDLAEENCLFTVAFPCITEGTSGFTEKEACITLIKAVKSWKENHRDSSVNILFCAEEDELFCMYENELKKSGLLQAFIQEKL